MNVGGLRDHVRRWLSPPPREGDPDVARVARHLHAALLVGIGLTGVMVPVAVLVFSPRPIVTGALGGGLLLGFVGLLVLARRGRVRLASVLLVALVWAHVALSLWWLGGVRSPILAVFFPLVLVAAMLLGTGASGIVVALSLVTSLAVLVSEAAGWLPATPPPSTLYVWLLFFVTLVAVVVLAHLTTSELRRTNRKLQAEIEERRRAEERLRASEEQLRQSHKMEAVGRLAGGVAHDFNNLLMVISGHGELLRRTFEADDLRRRKLDHIMGAAQRAAELVRRLLTFSRGPAVEPRLVDLNRVVADATRMMRPLLGPEISWRTRLAPDLGRVRADPAQVEQVLMNLAVNARDAMASGGRLEVETSNLEVGPGGPCPPGLYVRLAVTDTGAGMDAETRARVFEPFFTTKGDGHGTGLGLAMVYGIVRQSGGHISVGSEPGRGSTFTVYFPRVDEVEGTGEVLSPEAAERDTGGTGGVS